MCIWQSLLAPHPYVGEAQRLPRCQKWIFQAIDPCAAYIASLNYMDLTRTQFQHKRAGQTLRSGGQSYVFHNKTF